MTCLFAGMPLGQATTGMRFLKSGSGLIGVLLVLAITQLIGWGTIGLPAVVGRDLGADLGMSLPAVFAGSSSSRATIPLVFYDQAEFAKATSMRCRSICRSSPDCSPSSAAAARWGSRWPFPARRC